MPQRTIKIEVTGEEEVINAALDAFVRYHGWSDQVVDAQGNPVTPVAKDVYARGPIRSFLMDSVKAYSIQQAEKAAREAAASAAGDAVMATTLTLVVE